MCPFFHLLATTDGCSSSCALPVAQDSAAFCTVVMLADGNFNATKGEATHVSNNAVT